MKKSVLAYLFAIVAGITFYACGPSDQKVETEVRSALTSTNNTDISANVKKGTVTLTGSVATEEAKTAAEQAARSIKGVKSVNNEIRVVAPAPAVVNTDGTMQSTIATALKNAGFPNVTVAVSNGEVTLTGNVKRSDLQKVMQIANDASPKKVNNELALQ